MKAGLFRRRTNAFTLVELLVVIAIIGLLAALLMPALDQAKGKAKRIACVNNLKQIGVGFQSFAHDHNGKFPMQVSTNDGGALEFVPNNALATGQFYSEFHQFQPLAGILETPQMLVCPTDTRTPARSFATLQNSNLSYFVALSADYSQPMSVLAGDANLTGSTALANISAGGKLTWTAEQHHFRGNVLFSDGHVEEWGQNSGGQLAGNATLVLPTAPTSGSSSSSNASAASTAPGTTLPPALLARQAAEDQALSPPKTNPPADNAPSNSAPTKITFTPASHPNASHPVAITPQVDETNQVPADIKPTTNTVPVASSPADDDGMMTVFNRKAAKFLQGLIGWSYLLILLLLLLVAAYKLWRRYYERRR